MWHALAVSDGAGCALHLHGSKVLTLATYISKPRHLSSPQEDDRDFSDQWVICRWAALALSGIHAATLPLLPCSVGSGWCGRLFWLKAGQLCSAVKILASSACPAACTTRATRFPTATTRCEAGKGVYVGRVGPGGRCLTSSTDPIHSFPFVDSLTACS